MQNLGEIKKFVSTLPFGSFDCPFKDDFFSTVLRRSDNNKWFGIVLKASENYFKKSGVEITEERVVLNLKCPPDLQFFLTEKYPAGILPAYHMNKTHWISVVLGKGVPDEEIRQLLTLSYDITGDVR